MQNISEIIKKTSVYGSGHVTLCTEIKKKNDVEGTTIVITKAEIWVTEH